MSATYLQVLSNPDKTWTFDDFDTLLGVQHVAVIVKKTGEKQSFLQQRKISESFSNDIVGVDFWVDSTFGRFLTFFQDDDVRLRNVVPVVIIGFVVRWQSKWRRRRRKGIGCFESTDNWICCWLPSMTFDCRRRHCHCQRRQRCHRLFRCQKAS